MECVKNQSVFLNTSFKILAWSKARFVGISVIANDLTALASSLAIKSPPASFAKKAMDITYNAFGLKT